MNEILKTYDDGTKLVFEDGRFDRWLVSFYRNGQRDSSPTDIDLFTLLLEFGDGQVTWALIQNLADQIGSYTDFDALDIETPHGTDREQWVFDALAAMMLAEERKESAKLGKKIKLVGCYQVLIEGRQPWWAANWSRGRSAREIAKKYEFLWTPGVQTAFSF